jgi:hypothetical protein
MLLRTWRVISGAVSPKKPPGVPVVWIATRVAPSWRGASRQDARESWSVPHVGMPANVGVSWPSVPHSVVTPTGCRARLELVPAIGHLGTDSPHDLGGGRPLEVVSISVIHI